MSRIRKRSVTIRGHRTSFSLEQPFFDGLAEIARARRQPVATVIADIDAGRARDTNLSSALRLAVLDWARQTGGTGRPPAIAGDGEA